MNEKLSLDRDFTRFLDEPTFPYKVTVCVGDKRILCSGALLAQQSSVLEKKFREDDGVLMFEELLDETYSNTDGIIECINYLHGASMQFSIETLPTVMKFSCIYGVDGLFEKAITWFENRLNNTKSVKNALNFLTVSNSLNSDHSARLKSVICKFIRLNKDLFGTLCTRLLDNSVTGEDILLIMNEKPVKSDVILTKWTALSEANASFIAKHHISIDFNDVFQNKEQLLSFIAILSTGATSNETWKYLIELQRSVLDPHNSKKCDMDIKDQTPEDVKAGTSNSAAQAQPPSSSTKMSDTSTAAMKNTAAINSQHVCEKRMEAMSEKLNLDRDFTRFIIDDPTFPYKVTVCVGDKRILCSGALLAQQSSVLEKKFREDDGVLMFEELLDETYSNTYGIMECIHYLHGAPLQFCLDTLPIILKFSSIYQVEGLFDRAVRWLEKYLDDSHCVKSALSFLKVSKSLDNNHTAQVKSVICGFIRQNRDLFGRECVNCLDTEITGQDLILIIGQHPANSGEILMKWTLLSVENGNYIAKNHSKFDFNKLFPDSKQFSSFISNLTLKAKSADMLRNLLDLQRTFFESQKDQKNQATNESGTSHSSEAGSARLNFGPGKDASMSSVSRNISWTGNTLTYTGPFDSSINVRNLPTAVSNLLPNFLSYNSFEQHSSDESSEEEFTATRLYIGNLPPQAEETAIRRMFWKNNQCQDHTKKPWE
ncbi:hypothetical protein ACHWQZ_G018853 [Mnemiopsis leidyi]